MSTLVTGLWGWFFGTTFLALVGAAWPFAKSLRRVSYNAALSALSSGFFVFAFLGGLPFDRVETQWRFLAQVAVVTAAVLLYVLASVLGVLASRPVRMRFTRKLVLSAVAFLAISWLLAPQKAMQLGIGLACAFCLWGLGMCIRNALRGDRLARTAAVGVGFLFIALIGLSWIALLGHRVPLLVHIVTAISATLYVVAMVSVWWARYAYLIELRTVMAYGPSYDPVTRLRSPAETQQMAIDVFKNRSADASLGVLVIIVANLYPLEKLYGAAATNHALFGTAGRLRRVLPAGVQAGRLGNEGFLLLMPHCRSSGHLIDMARRIVQQLQRPLVLNTRREAAAFESHSTHWHAEVGIGTLMVNDAGVAASDGVAMAHAMARTAISYESRIGWFDHGSGEIAELPVLAPA
jgi:GGDEF domain-containing protein